MSKFAGSRKKLNTGIKASTPMIAAAARLRSMENAVKNRNTVGKIDPTRKSQ